MEEEGEREREKDRLVCNNSQSAPGLSLCMVREERGNKLQAEMKQDDRCQMNKTSLRVPEILAGSWISGLPENFSFS